MIMTSNRVVWFNNPVGVATTEDGRKIKYGCGGPGASDCLGMLRDGSARFVAMEVKRPLPGCKTTADQDRFLALVKRHGGIAFVARSVGEANAALDKAIAEFKIMWHIPRRLTDLAKPFPINACSDILIDGMSLKKEG